MTDVLLSSGAATETILRGLLDTAPDAMVIVDKEAQIVFVNAEAERLFGHRREELIGSPVEILLPERLRAAHGGHRTNYLAQPSTRPMGLDLDLYGLRRDGSEFPVEISLSPLETEAGFLVVSSIRDLTERRRVEDALRRSETLFRGLLEAAPDAKVIVDAEAKIVLVNNQTETVFGYGRDELIGQPVEVLLPERFRAAHKGHRDAFLAAPSLRPMGVGLDLLGRRKDGTEFPVDISLSPYETPDGRLILSAIRDVTQQKEAEAEIRRLATEAERANAAKSEFLSRMSHELRTPLNAIIGFGQLLQSDVVDDEQRESVTHILRAGRHLLSLVNEILDVAQIEAGKMAISVEPVHVEEVVNEALELIAPLAAERPVGVRALPPPGRVHVLADRQRLLQVVLNLLGNAVKYDAPGGTVEISWATHTETRVRLAVRDNGPGVPADELESIFAPFERLEHPDRESEGTGLGLALARSLVDAMGGTIGAESVVGKGSTFWVELATAEEPPAGVEPPAPEEGGRTVLHIEDNISGQQLVERLLHRLTDIRVISAIDGTTGIALARRYRPDAILLDLHLPDLSGHDVLARLRRDEATRETPVVILSADTTRAAARQAAEAGATDFVTKPIDADVLVAVVDELTKPRPLG